MGVLEILALVATGGVSFAAGLRIGSNNPVRVKLVSEKIEDVAKEALEKAVQGSVDEIKRLRK